MRKALVTSLFVLAFIASLTAQLTIPNTFTAGTVADPDQVNANFAVTATACNRTGCTMTGILKAIAGTDALPGVVNSTDTSTGMVIGATGAISWSLSGTQRLLLNATGLTIFGTNVLPAAGGLTVNGVGVIASTGKIPDLSSTYFTAISASNFTAGTVPPARLGSGTPSATTFLRGDSSWATAGDCAPTVVATAVLVTAALCQLIEANGTFTVTLPAASTATAGGRNIVDVKNVGTGTITVARAGADTIDGATSFTLSLQYQSVTVVANAAGNGWLIR